MTVAADWLVLSKIHVRGITIMLRVVSATWRVSEVSVKLLRRLCHYLPSPNQIGLDAMSKQSQISFTALLVLLAGPLLAGCSGTSSDDGSSSALASRTVASASTAAATSPVASQAPVAYTPELTTGVVTTCNIEKFDNSTFQSMPVEAALSAAHSISGWITAPKMTTPSFSLRLDDKSQNRYFQLPVVFSVKRPDVVSSANSPTVPLMSGFVLRLVIHAVPAGRYHLYLAVQAGGKTSICDNGRHVDFK